MQTQKAGTLDSNQCRLPTVARASATAPCHPRSGLWGPRTSATVVHTGVAKQVSGGPGEGVPGRPFEGSRLVVSVSTRKKSLTGVIWAY